MVLQVNDSNASRYRKCVKTTIKLRFNSAVRCVALLGSYNNPTSVVLQVPVGFSKFSSSKKAWRFERMSTKLIVKLYLYYFISKSCIGESVFIRVNIWIRL